jgi:cytochrome c oxidase subunit 2
MLNKLLGIVPNASAHGKQIDQLIEFCHWFMVVLFVGWISYFLFVIWRFHRSRNPVASYYGFQSHATTHIEFSVILIEAVILIGFAVPLWNKRIADIPAVDVANAVRIRAIGYQFNWYFHYAGQDGVFAAQNSKYVSGVNPLGLDPTDKAAADDIFVPAELSLKLNTPSVVFVTSRDVIHGLALHRLRVQQDAIPGSEVPMAFRPIVATPEGESWDIICAQLCGAGHAIMKASYLVKPEPDFDKWYKEQLGSQSWKTVAPAAKPEHALEKAHASIQN